MLNVVIPTIGVENVVAPNTNFVRGGILIGFSMNLNHGSEGVSMRRNFSRSSEILLTTIGVVATPHIVFTNPIITTHVNMTID